MENKEITQWNFFIHLSQLAGFVVPLGNIIAPLIMWQMKKDEDPSIDAHGKEVINWQISLFIYTVVALLLSFIFIGLLILPVLALAYIIFAIIGAMNANKGELWKYPLTIRLIK